MRKSGWEVTEESVTFAEEQSIVALSLVFVKGQQDTGASAIRLVRANPTEFESVQTIPAAFPLGVSYNVNKSGLGPVCGPVCRYM